MKRKLSVVNSIFLFILIFIVYVSYWLKSTFYNIKFEGILYIITHREGGNNDAVVYDFIVAFIIFIALILVLLFINWISIKLNKQLVLNINCFKRSKRLVIYPISFGKVNNVLNKVIVKIVLILITIVYFGYSFKVIDFIKHKTSISMIYEERYVSPDSISIVFPKVKRNLIYINLESMESSYSNYLNDNLISNLEVISSENISFSNNESFGGLYQANLTDWTMASLVGQTTGIPFNIPIDDNAYGKYQEFLPGIISLGEILEEENYNQVFMIGSNADFGSRRQYYTQKGNYEIWDYLKAKELKRIDKDYFVFWGYEDKKLFEFAKDKLNELYEMNEPFNLTLLTVDTHFFDGYVDSECELKYDVSYANAILCSDKKIKEFIDWIKLQPFYENTTIILVGDHLTMNNNFLNDNSDRKIYNAIINSPIKTNNTKNRIATVLDFFPTTLASLGVEIEGNRLGLGTNLFSNEKTIGEEMGFDEFNGELIKNSKYYAKFLK